jgi:hypothetical protein
MTFFVAKSSAFKNIYSENQNSSFKFQLFERGSYNYAYLHEIIIPPIEKAYIARAHLNVLSVSQLGSKNTSLFKLIAIRASELTQVIQFPNPHKIQIACPLFDELAFSLIDDSTNTLIKFPIEPLHDTYVSIEFRK